MKQIHKITSFLTFFCLGLIMGMISTAFDHVAIRLSLITGSILVVWVIQTVLQRKAVK
jgi:uncharacterized transporter YbjL